MSETTGTENKTHSKCRAGEIHTEDSPCSEEAAGSDSRGPCRGRKAGSRIHRAEKQQPPPPQPRNRWLPELGPTCFTELSDPGREALSWPESLESHGHGTGRGLVAWSLHFSSLIPGSSDPSLEGLQPSAQVRGFGPKSTPFIQIKRLFQLGLGLAGVQETEVNQTPSPPWDSSHGVRETVRHTWINNSWPVQGRVRGPQERDI